MRCPHCKKSIAGPFGWNANVSGVDVIMVTCPYCHSVLGVVNAK